MKKPTCVIELHQPTPGYLGFSSEEVNEFRRKVLGDAVMSRAFIKLVGRRFYFRFPDPKQNDEFLSSTALYFKMRNVGYTREMYPAK